MSTDQRSVDWYNANAEQYSAHVRDASDSVFHSLYEKPAMYALLPDLNEKRVLSLGCGPGEDSAELKRRGAAESVGIDISERLIDIARTNHPDCNFHVGDMEHLPFGDGSFDVAYSSLAIHYLKDWTPVFREVARVLEPGGYFLVSFGHPTHEAMDVTVDTPERKCRVLSIDKDRTRKQLTVTGNYFAQRPNMGSGEMDVTTWRKTFDEVSHESRSAGFVIDRLVEPKPLPAMEQVNPLAYTSLMRVPFFAVVKLWKPEGLHA